MQAWMVYAGQQLRDLSGVQMEGFQMCDQRGTTPGAGEPGKSVLVKEEFRWTLKDNGRGGEKKNRSEQDALVGVLIRLHRTART